MEEFPARGLFRHVRCCPSKQDKITDLDYLTDVSPALETIPSVDLDETRVLFTADPPWKGRPEVTPTEGNLRHLQHDQELKAAQWMGLTCLRYLTYKRKMSLFYAYYLGDNELTPSRGVSCQYLSGLCSPDGEAKMSSC